MIQKRLNWLTLMALLFSASACSFPITESIASPTEAPIPVTELPTSSPAGNCYYVWAYKPLPDLSAQIQESIRQIQPTAEANAQAYGENCVYEDGHADFSAMETDFSVSMQVDDLNNADDLGNWIKQTMTVIDRIPPDQLAGPQPGRVTLLFKSSADQRYVSFSIPDYHKLSPGLSNADLLQALSVK